MAGQKNKAGLVNRFLGHVLPGVIRPMQRAVERGNRLSAFIVLALIFAGSAWRSVRAIDGNSESVVKAAAAVGFTLLMAYFGISSFEGSKDIAIMSETPGSFPYTRGIYPDMYRGRLWTMRQYAGFGSAEESNRRYRYLLSQGTAGLSVAFDLPTQMGLDSDDTLAAGDVGRVAGSRSARWPIWRGCSTESSSTGSPRR